MNCILSDLDVKQTYIGRMAHKQGIKMAKYLPLNSGSALAQEFAYVTGKVFGDGHIDQNYSAVFVGSCEEVAGLAQYLQSNFHLDKLKLSEKKAKGVSYQLRLNDSLFGRILVCLGAPKGNKTRQNIFVPNWILNDQSCRKRFLQALFEDELSTIKIEKKSHAISPKFKMVKNIAFIHNLSEFLSEVKTSAESFGIECSKLSRPVLKENASFEMYFCIRRNKLNILKFRDNIGFSRFHKKWFVLNECCTILEATKHYHKTPYERNQIVRLRKEGNSLRTISRMFYVSPSTVQRITTRPTTIPIAKTKYAGDVIRTREPTKGQDVSR